VKEQFYSIIRLAIALGVFTLVEPRLDELTKTWGLWGKLATNGVALIVSSLIVVVALGKLFSPLKLSLEWSKDRVSVRGPCEQLRRPPQSLEPLAAYDLFVECQSDSLRAALAVWACRKFGAILTVTMAPGESISLVSELAHSAATVDSATITFKLNRVETGTVSWVAVSLEPSPNMPRDIRIRCQPKVSHLWWLLRWQIQVDSRLREFEVTEGSVV